MGIDGWLGALKQHASFTWQHFVFEKPVLRNKSFESKREGRLID